MVEGWEPLRWPGHYVSRIARGLHRIADARLKSLGFATAQLPVLRALKDGERYSQTELARLAGVEQPSMAQLLARMERDGLIERAPDPRDRRGSLIALTDAARQKLPQGQAVLIQGNHDATAGLSRAEIDTLVGLLARVLANVEALEI